MDDPVFRFTMRATPADTSGYYHPRWDTAQKLTVLAGTRRGASEKATAMLGEVRSGYQWIFAFDQIDEIPVINQKSEEAEESAS